MLDEASATDWAALAIWIVIAILSWVSWGLLQNQRLVFDRKRGIALGIGLATTLATWCQFVLMRDRKTAADVTEWEKGIGE